MGETLGGLLNATFGNAVELIVCLCAITISYIPMQCNRRAKNIFLPITGQHSRLKG